MNLVTIATLQYPLNKASLCDLNRLIDRKQDFVHQNGNELQVDINDLAAYMAATGVSAIELVSTLKMGIKTYAVAWDNAHAKFKAIAATN